MQVAKWGNSLAVRLPKALVDRLGLKAGDDVTVVDAAPTRLTLEKSDGRQAALDRMAARNWPADDRFDRDAANER